ncbi:hypothetical protein NDU88_009274 [Pleurodeles waltl]|uniref:Uncharacterized protein n=1 Tax=Pleurodeles waltl TaxID=8319 RepID=A0AAV7PVE9_PLEWA|nr:hypothetical protein NDU88_009274 [Pleurodeles waltl]
MKKSAGACTQRSAVNRTCALLSASADCSRWRNNVLALSGARWKERRERECETKVTVGQEGLAFKLIKLKYNQE